MRVLLLSLLLALGACTATPTIDPGAPVSPQGLVKVSNTIMDEVYVYPELDLSGYDKLMIEGLGIEFRYVGPWVSPSGLFGAVIISTTGFRPEG